MNTSEMVKIMKCIEFLESFGANNPEWMRLALEMRLMLKDELTRKA